MLHLGPACFLKWSMPNIWTSWMPNICNHRAGHSYFHQLEGKQTLDCKIVILQQILHACGLLIGHWKPSFASFVFTFFSLCSSIVQNLLVAERGRRHLMSETFYVEFHFIWSSFTRPNTEPCGPSRSVLEGGGDFSHITLNQAGRYTRGTVLFIILHFNT